MRPLALPVALAASPALTNGEVPGGAFREGVRAACSPLFGVPPGAIAMFEARQFGSESCGPSLVADTADHGASRLVRVQDRATRRAELTAPLLSP